MNYELNGRVAVVTGSVRELDAVLPMRLPHRVCA